MKLVRRFLHSHFLKFGIVGSGGYLADVAILKAMIAAGMDDYRGQIPAFIGATIFTWIANRLWTFRDRRGGVHIGKEGMRYLGVTIGGFCVNYAAYAAMVTIGGIWKQHIFLSVAAGSIAGLMFNFPMAKYLVFNSAASALQADHASPEDR
jgi:putative flippase GtrA